MLRRFKSISKSKKGQTLIETVVTVGVVVIIVGSLVLLVIANGRRANFSKQADQATKLAQEGLEFVRNIRDTDAVIKVGTKAGVSCNIAACTFKDLYTRNYIIPLQACLKRTTHDSLVPVTDSANCEYSIAGGVYLSNIFRRDFVIFENNRYGGGVLPCGTSGVSYLDTKIISARVYWNSVLGSETRQLETCLTNRYK